MGKEILAIPEDYLRDVVEVIRNGLEMTPVPDDVREALEGWCDDMSDDEDDDA